MTGLLLGLGFLIGYSMMCVDKFITWYVYERDLDEEFQRHRKWWKI